MAKSGVTEFSAILRRREFEHYEFDKLYNIFSLRKYCKKIFFQHAGDNHDLIGIVKSGVFRFFYIDHHGKERTKHFVTDGGYLLSISSYISGCSLSFSIQALTGSEVYVATLKDFRTLVDSSVELQKLYFYHLQDMYILKEKREESLLLKNPAERYNEFISVNRELFNSIPQQYVVSYL